jgi:hypothetical protein
MIAGDRRRDASYAALTLFAVVYARTRLGGAMPTRRPNR